MKGCIICQLIAGVVGPQNVARLQDAVATVVERFFRNANAALVALVLALLSAGGTFVLGALAGSCVAGVAAACALLW